MIFREPVRIVLLRARALNAIRDARRCQERGPWIATPALQDEMRARSELARAKVLDFLTAARKEGYRTPDPDADWSLESLEGSVNHTIKVNRRRGAREVQPRTATASNGPLTGALTNI